MVDVSSRSGMSARGRFAGLFVPLRLRHGISWRRDVPSLTELAAVFRVWLIALTSVAALLVVYAVADLITRNGDLAAKAAEAEAAAVRATATLADCMNGRARFLHPNNSGRGHGMTAVVCEPAYSVDI